jgi:RNA polymerase sigma-70 factor (ECF subfamily)
MPALSHSADTLPSTLLLALRDQQPDAWARLTHLFGPLVYGWCRRAGLGPADAADVTQDIFRSLTTGLSGFRREQPGDTFRGWLAVIARNRIRDFLRGAAQRPQGRGGSEFHQLVQQVPDEADSDSSFTSDADTERREVLRRALDLVQAEFETRTWTAFWRTAIEGEAPDVVAAELGVSINAVYKAKSRILRRLREELSGMVD